MENNKPASTPSNDRALFKVGAVLFGAVLYYLGSEVVGHKVSVDAVIVIALMLAGVFVWTFLWESRRARKSKK